MSMNAKNRSQSLKAGKDGVTVKMTKSGMHLGLSSPTIKAWNLHEGALVRLCLNTGVIRNHENE